MKLSRICEPGAEVPGVLDAAGVPRSLFAVIGDVSGPTLMADSLRAFGAVDLDSLPPLALGRYGPPRSGVGLGLKPPRYLAPGDVTELGVEGLGSQRHRIVTSAAAVAKLAS